jgi:hypothetical protein
MSRKRYNAYKMAGNIEENKGTEKDINNTRRTGRRDNKRTEGKFTKMAYYSQFIGKKILYFEPERVIARVLRRGLNCA